MRFGRLRALMAMLLMIASSLTAQALRPTARLADLQPKVSLKALFPESFGDWHVDDQVPAQLVAPDAEALINKIYSQTLSRVYVNHAGARIMLSVAYGGDQSDATRAHRPEVCYPAQGFLLLSTNDTHLPVAGRELPVRELVTRQGSRVEPLIYWIVVGNRIALSATDQKLAQLSYGIHGLIADGMLVRVSEIDPDTAESFALQKTFVEQMSRAIPPDLRPRVFGKATA